jgi:hypothetical protein
MPTRRGRCRRGSSFSQRIPTAPATPLTGSPSTRWRGPAMHRPRVLASNRVGRLVALGALGLFALGCGSSGADSVGSSSSALTSDSGVECPSSPPTNGASCSSKGLACSWGTDPRFGCRPQALCVEDEGKLVWEAATASCPPPPSCPKSAPRTTGNGCLGQTKCSEAELGATCVYDDVAFTCAPCSGNLCCDENTWSVTDLANGCPNAVPNFGDTCTTSKLYCNYNSCADDQQNDTWAYGVGERCEKGEWQPYTDGACR